jgi:hypothetical protein
MRDLPYVSAVEARVLERGLAILGGVSLFFLVFKLAMWSSVVVHAEKASIHRLFFGRYLVRFPQEPVTLVDVLTAFFLMFGGAAALTLSAWMSDRIRSGSSNAADLAWARPFWRMAGAGLVWLGLDELFTIHELIAANLGFDDNWVLVVYAIGGLAACIRWRDTLLTSRPALAVLFVGALFHGSSILMDHWQDSFTWLPEEPFEMLAAGLYCIGMALYCVKTLSAGPLAEVRHRAAASEVGALA